MTYKILKNYLFLIILLLAILSLSIVAFKKDGIKEGKAKKSFIEKVQKEFASFKYYVSNVYNSRIYYNSPDKDNLELINQFTKNIPNKLTEDEFLAAKQAIDDGNLLGIGMVIVQDHKFYPYLSKINKDQHYRVEIILKQLKGSGVGKLLQNGVFLIRYFDTIQKNEKEFEELISEKLSRIPVFVFAISEEILDKFPGKFILFPDDYTIGDFGNRYHKGWKKLSEEIELANSKFLWENKIEKIFWQGKLSDCGWPYCSESPRLKLVNMAKDHEYVSAIFASLFKIECQEYESRDLPCGSFMEQSNQLQYKYLITLDGSTCTYPGLLYRLYSNSVVLKQETGNIQWFYPLLKPFEHYIPVSKDLNDLTEKYQWLKSHDEEARNISIKAYELIKKAVSYEHMMFSYIPHILNKYSNTLDFDVAKFNKKIIEEIRRN